MKKKNNILLAFYGDDLTGSTDALEFICRAGLKSVLFMDTPGTAQLEAYPELQAFGVAGFTRSLPPDSMEEILVPAFRSIRKTGARHVHYKICSTFDSSPETGSIGKAIDCGYEVFQNSFIPVLGGMPTLGRYCVFGNLFARMGIGSNGEVFRLDRHPSMSRHPVTPAGESDLRLHLASQTDKKISLIDVITMEKNFDQWNKSIDSNDKVVLLDALHEEHLQKIGAWLDTQQTDIPLFSVGPSGIEWALGFYWNQTKLVQHVQSWPQISRTTSLLVLSGSCSPVTKQQIEFAVSRGFMNVPLEMKITGSDGSISVECDLSKIITALQNEQSVIVHTGTITDIDPSSSAEILGKALGDIGKNICELAEVKRIVIAGGDTSSYAARALGIEALEMIAPFLPGAPLCKAHAPGSPLNGIEINLKGGQVGGEDYFMTMREGNHKH